jgi:hypothetical protein
MKMKNGRYDRYVKYEVEEVLSRFYKNQVGKEFVDLLFYLKSKLNDVVSLSELDEVLKQENFGFKLKYDKISGILHFYRKIDFETISIFEFEDFKIAKIDYDIIRKSSQYEIVEILKDFVDLLFSQMSEKINNSMNKNSLSIDEKIFRAKMIDE